MEGFVVRVVVIGGGISGLASAREALDRVPHAELTVLEAGGQVGGCIQSDSVNGFLCEAGPSGFLNRDPSTVALAERLGLGDEIIAGCEAVRRRYILSGGRLRRFPDSPREFITSDLLSVRARLRVMLEPALPPRRDGVEETVAQFARRRLGREAADLLIDPVVSGIYAGDPNRLSASAAVPNLVALDGNGRSLIRALIHSRQRRPERPGAAPSAMSRHRYVSLRGGIGQLVRALERSLRPNIRLRSPVRSVRRVGDEWRIVVDGPQATELVADVVVSAAPAPAAGKYLKGLHPHLDELCTSVPYTPVAMVCLGYREADVPNPLHGFGYLVPSREPGRILGVLWSTSIFPGHRASDGRVLLQAILGGARSPGICEEDDESLVTSVRVQLNRALAISTTPIFRQTYRHQLGLPQYELGHGRRVQQADAGLLRLPGLLLSGNAFRGVGINACTAEAVRVGDAVAAYAATMRPRTPAMSLMSPMDSGC